MWTADVSASWVFTSYTTRPIDTMSSSLSGRIPHRHGVAVRPHDTLGVLVDDRIAHHHRLILVHRRALAFARAGEGQLMLVRLIDGVATLVLGDAIPFAQQQRLGDRIRLFPVDQLLPRRVAGRRILRGDRAPHRVQCRALAGRERAARRRRLHDPAARGPDRPADRARELLRRRGADRRAPARSPPPARPRTHTVHATRPNHQEAGGTAPPRPAVILTPAPGTRRPATPPRPATAGDAGT